MSKIVYFWWTIGFLLLAAETLLPGAALFWFGLAALSVGAVLVVLPGLGMITQVVLFGVFSAIWVGVYFKFFRKGESKSDQPLLNRRSAQLVGRVLVLEEAIQNGQGKARVGDSLWVVQGPDQAAGSTVRVLDVMDSVLKVEAAE